MICVLIGQQEAEWQEILSCPSKQHVISEETELCCVPGRLSSLWRVWTEGSHGHSNALKRVILALGWKLDCRRLGPEPMAGKVADVTERDRKGLGCTALAWGWRFLLFVVWKVA